MLRHVLSETPSINSKALDVITPDDWNNAIKECMKAERPGPSDLWSKLLKAQELTRCLVFVTSLPYSIRLRGSERWYSVTKLGSGFLKSIGQFEKLSVA